jgi:hypothetical protein
MAFGLVAAAFLAAGCQLGTQPPQTASLQADDLRNRAEEHKEEIIRKLAKCETGDFGPSERPIYGGQGAYLGRMQFSVQTIISYHIRKDGERLSIVEATKLAHDYDRATKLAKYMIFDLEEPWHWPLCAKKISLRSEMAKVKGFVDQAEVAAAKGKTSEAIVEAATAEVVNHEAEGLYPP